MTVLLSIFTLTKVAGSILGAGGSVFTELLYLRAVSDGRIDVAEKVHLRLAARVLKWGMLIFLISSIALVLVEFIYDAPVQRALTSGYWIEMGLVFAIIFFAWALSRKIIRFAISSGAIFTGWWFIALLSFEQLPDMTFGAAVAFYVVVAGIITAFLAYLRTMVMRKV